MIYLAIAFACLASGLATYWIADSALSDQRQVRRVLQQVTKYEAGQAEEIEPLLKPLTERLVRPLADRLKRLLRSAGMAEYRASLGRAILVAGEPRGMDPDRLLALKVVVLFSVAAVCLPLALASSAGGDNVTALLMAAFVPLSFFLPDLWISRLGDERRTAIRRQLPDVLDILTISVEAGLGFDAALVKMCRKTEGPLPAEFGRMLQEIHAGVARKDAMRHLAERCDVPEVKTFATAMIQADVFGVSVSQILRTQASEMRLRRRQRAEELAQQAPVKLVFPVILCILPATMLVILGPAAISIMQTLGGQ